MLAKLTRKSFRKRNDIGLTSLLFLVLDPLVLFLETSRHVGGSVRILGQILDIDTEFLYRQLGLGDGLLLFFHHAIESQQLIVEALQCGALLLELSVCLVIRSLVQR